MFKHQARFLVLAFVSLSAVLSGCGSSSIEVEGTFTLIDDFPLDSTGDRCGGEGGYSDINSLTPVKVEHIDGTTVARTELGDGKIPSTGELASIVSTEDDPMTVEELDNFLDFTDKQLCLFRFSVDVPSGSDEGKGYVVKVGDRGEMFLTEEELQEPGAIGLSLGDL